MKMVTFLLLLSLLCAVVCGEVIVPSNPAHRVSIPGEEVGPKIDTLIKQGVYLSAKKLTGSPRPKNLLSHNQKHERTQFGIDNRSFVTSPQYPNSMVGRIDTAGGSVCTGTMVGKNLVLTASHCMRWENGSFGWVTFRPAFQSGVSPFGVAHGVKVWYWRENSASLLPNQIALDYVVIQLDQDLGTNTSYAGVQEYISSWNNALMFTHYGYPCCDGITPCAYNCDKKVKLTTTFKSSQAYLCDSDTCTGHEGQMIKHCADINGGQSGGPFWFQDSDELYYVVAVQSTHAMSGPGKQNACAVNDGNSAAGGRSLVDIVLYARTKS